MTGRDYDSAEENPPGVLRGPRDLLEHPALRPDALCLALRSRCRAAAAGVMTGHARDSEARNTRGDCVAAHAPLIASVDNKKRVC
jgi:hypothetical protein